MAKKTKKNNPNEPQNKKIVAIRIAGMVIFAVLLIMSTYAWFTSQKDITIYNLRGTVEVSENMEISLDAKMWYHKINLGELVDGKTPLQLAVESRNAVYGGVPLTAPNIEPQELLPVSTVGSIGATYVPFYQGTAKTKTVTSLESIEECDEYYEENANAPKDNGYFAFDIYIKNTSRDDEPDTLQLNLNSAVQVIKEDIEKELVYNGVTTNRTYKGQAYSGIQNTIRVALALYEDTTGTITTQKEILDATKGSKISKVAIWEPNAPYHVQYVVDNNNKLTGSKKVEFENGDKLTTYALNSNSIAGDAKIENVYNTDDASLSEQVTLQTEMSNTTKDEEDYRILPDEDGNPIDITDIEDKLFQIQANKVSRLRVYVWMEGQDVDCINLASFGGGIELDLGLTKDNAIGDVLTEDDDEGTEPTNTVNGN